MENCWKTCKSDFFKKMKSGPVRRMRERSKNRKNTKSRKVEKRKTSKSVFSRKFEKSKSGSVREKSKNTTSRKVEKDRFSTFLLFVFFALFLFFYFSIFLLFSRFLFFYFSCEKRRQKMWRLQKPLFFYFLTFWLFSSFSVFFFSYFSQPKTCTDKKIPNVTSNWLRNMVDPKKCFHVDRRVSNLAPPLRWSSNFPVGCNDQGKITVPAPFNPWYPWFRLSIVCN